ncbi:MAG TPA: hypothetical protein VF796_21930 [Humisphaera sp.]
MSAEAFTFTFASPVSMREVADTLHLARLAAEALHGPERVALGARTRVDGRRRTVTVEAATPAGMELALVFLGYCRREFGPAAVTVAAGGGPAG